jgi:IS5 family transposase
VHADKGYDANALRQKIQERGALANIPPKANRKLRIPTKPATHSNRKPATDSDLKPAGVPI